MAQLSDAGLGEGQARSGAASLPGERAGDRGVVVVFGQAADQVHGGGVSGPPGCAEAGQRGGQAGAGTAFPVDGERCGACLLVGRDGDLGDQGADQLLALAGSGGGGIEDSPDVGSGCFQPAQLFGGQRAGLAALLGSQRGPG
jgi:hypothetical protein